MSRHDQVNFALGSFASEERGPFPGLLIGNQVYAIDQLFETRAGGADLAGCRTTLEILEKWDLYFPLLAERAADLAQTPGSGAQSWQALQTLAPVQPRQVICAGANYRMHVMEMLVDHPTPQEAHFSRAELIDRTERLMAHWSSQGQPYVYSKPVSTVRDPFADFVVPADCDQVDWELELGVVIGRTARRVSRDHALEYVAGYTVVNDISARDRVARPDFPRMSSDWVACKAGPGFLPLGPVIVPKAFVEDPQKLQLELRLNGQVMQNESTGDMVFPVARLIEHISTYMTLLPGDVICTGSPSGNGAHFGRYLRPDDVLEGSIAGLGTQRNLCVAEVLTEGAILHRPFAPFVL